MLIGKRVGVGVGVSVAVGDTVGVADGDGVREGSSVMVEDSCVNSMGGGVRAGASPTEVFNEQALTISANIR
jgi:hypothetical protein